MTPERHLLQISSLSLRRSGALVLDDLSLAIEQGQFVGLIGPNGAGKTSLLRIIAARLRGDGGRCVIDGHCAVQSPLAYRRMLGAALAPEELPADLSPRQLLQLVAAARELDQVPEESLWLAERLGLTPWLDRSIGNCSLGARQKAGLIAGMLGKPPLLVFDEPFNGLDPLAAFEFKSVLSQWTREGSCAVLLATHGIEVAERLLDRAVLLIHGKIADQWTRAELEQLREQGSDLEAAMVQSLRKRAEAASSDHLPVGHGSH